MGTISLSIPQVGQPDSTEDPKVANNFTTLQTWANGNIDASNISSNSGFLKLAYRQMNASAAAASGDWVVAGPSVTVTLPAPAQNAIVAVLANASVTGTTPVTISGTNIYGLGLSAASSFTLGQPLASVLLESDGSSWSLLDGSVQDTGWINLGSLGTNVTLGNPAGQYRLRGNQVFLRGILSTNSTVTAGATIVTLPSVARPPATRVFPNVLGNATAITTITSAGVVTCGSSIASLSSYYLDSISFSL